MTTSIAVTLLASPHALVREALVARVRAERPGLAVLRHELATLGTDGVVHRVVHRPEGPDQDVELEVDASCCLSCLLRDDTLAALADLAREDVDHVLVVLPASVEPAAVATTLAEEGVVRLDAVVAVVDADRLEDDLHRDEPSTLDLPPGDEDERTVAEVVGRHLEHADLVLHRGGDARAVALLAALAADAQVAAEDVPLRAWLAASLHDSAALAAITTVGVPRPCRPTATEGVASKRWVRRRPLHPLRFSAAVEAGDLAGLVRASGHVWVATRPRTVLEVELLPCGYEIAAAGAWVDAAPEQPLPPLRAEASQVVWHPYWGDRTQDLVLVVLDRDVAEIVEVLDACLLTDEELAGGEDAWRELGDPFDGLGDEDDHLAPLLRGREDRP